MKLNLTPIPVKMFTHHKDTKTFVSEMSDLHGNGHNYQQRIYDDACDCGFPLYNPCTNRSVLMILNNVVNTDDGELTCYEYTPIQTDIDKFPALKGYKVVIYND